MSRRYHFVQADVFTGTPFGGNQLAVFTDARGLSVDEMQTLAHEMYFSESTFVLPPEIPNAVKRVRIFTPGKEMPMAGHPTVGTAFVLAQRGRHGHFKSDHHRRRIALSCPDERQAKIKTNQSLRQPNRASLSCACVSGRSKRRPRCIPPPRGDLSWSNPRPVSGGGLPVCKF